MKENLIKEKSTLFALSLIEEIGGLETRHEYILSKQLVRAGTGIGANVREAIAAESKRDFLHKLQIALKEARECEYWLEVLQKSKYKNCMNYTRLEMELTTVIKILVRITKTVAKQLAS